MQSGDSILLCGKSREGDLRFKEVSEKGGQEGKEEGEMATRDRQNLR